MIRKPNRIDPWRWFWLGLLGIVVTAILLACATARQATPLAAPSVTMTITTKPTPLPAPPTITSSATPTKTATHTPPPSPTSTLTPKPTWTPFKKSLTEYFLRYDKNATAEIPPLHSYSFGIWQGIIPATPVQSTPQFIPYPPPDLSANSDDLLLEAGCEIPTHYNISCAQDSPLRAFGCSHLLNPNLFYFKPTTDLALLAGCFIRDEDWKNAPEGTLFIVGCAFKHRQGYIFMTGETYTLIETINALKELFVPIESPAEALTYAQLRTGLYAYFDLSYDPTLLYLQEKIEGTHVTEEAGGYVMNLYHLEVCGCEPWITSQVMIRVDRAGSITWESAIPVYFTTGFGCAD